jgi:CBS domain-containing protein
VTNGGRPIGIITERNILEGVVAFRHDAGLVKAKDIMTRPLITIDINASIEEAAHLMANKTIKTLPVVDGQKVVGVITSSDIVRNNPTQISILEELLRV